MAKVLTNGAIKSFSKYNVVTFDNGLYCIKYNK